MRAFIEYMETVLPKENILCGEPMDKHTTFRVGGEAEVFLKIENEKQLAAVLKYLNIVEKPYFVLGNGSNLLVGDKGYRGAILKLEGDFKKLEVTGTCLRAGAGALLSQAAAEALRCGLCGMEFAAGIPGSVGGAVVMNAGAYGGEMADIVKTVRVMSKEGEILELDHATMEFAYRSSVIKNRPYIVLDTVFSLKEGDREEIESKMKELAEQRRQKQPLEFPSAGSTFKRPEGYFAGKLIMDSGLRGFQIGGAKVSDKHCGFVINTGNAQAADVAELIEEVRERVHRNFGIWLEPEVIFLGDF